MLLALHKTYTNWRNSTVKTTHLSFALEMVNLHGLIMSEEHRITGLERIRGGWHERKRHPLQDLMRECRYRSATDPKDKIYSLLGLMGDHMNDLLQPDYSKSVGNVRLHNL